MNPLEKFQELLRELFQLKDAAELDFGIYRILNLRRAQVEEFITTRLPAIIDEAFAEYSAADLAELRDRLAKLRADYAASVGEAAFGAGGELRDDLRGTERGKEYTDLHSRLKTANATEELKSRVYNDLHGFFSRYYDDGDFITRRRIRYTGGEAYAIPYGGEEVVLHWATKDQYYVKTTEQLRNYRFRVRDYGVAFDVVATEGKDASGHEQKRYFVLASVNPVELSEEQQTLLVRFEFRPLTSAEQKAHGRTETQRPQEKLNQQAEEEILAALSDKTLKMLLAATEAETDKSLLLRHLGRFTRKNTSDYFIHKDLRGFLERELDYFIKTDCVQLGELVDAESPKLAQANLLRARVVRRIAGHIIDFLAQIEDFQKRLFEKRKFVLRTDYCITINRIPEEFWPEILASKAQLAEWQDLISLNDLLKAQKKRKLDVELLRLHPTLVVDTKHFADDFRWRLLAQVDGIAGQTDGLLIHGENLQALNLLAESYRERVSCVHIDPPYNTQTSGFLYKNSYQHSSWLAMMEDRMRASASMLTVTGAYLCHIDENEYERLHMLFAGLVPDAGTVIWDKRNPMNSGQGIATQHEYIIWRSSLCSPIHARDNGVPKLLAAALDATNKHGVGSAMAQRTYQSWLRSEKSLGAGERAYRYLDERGRVFQSVSLRAPEPRTDAKFHEPLIHPKTGKPCPVPPNGFSRTPRTLADMMAKGEILFGPDERTQPRQKVLLSPETKRQLSSVVEDGHKGKADLDALGLEFPYCHPVSLYVQLEGAATTDIGCIILDHFAGSGTSAHAAVVLNREDGAGRRFVLVEVGDYFDTVLLPRVKKVTYSPEWKDGKPVRAASEVEAARGPHIMKYHVIEDYEDTLGNIALCDSSAQTSLALFGDDYLLKYMLDVESRGSNSLLNVEAFARPFDYKLTIQDGAGTRECPVDLVETFNYLLGLDVRRLRQFEAAGRIYRAVLGDQRGKSVVVVWRAVDDIAENKTALLHDRAFIEKTILPALLPDAARPDKLYVNAACLVDGAMAIEPEFKQRMFAPVA